MDITIANVIKYSLLLILSSIVILHALKKFNMKTTFKVYMAFAIIVAVYIPFYFGGKIFADVISNTYKNTFGAYFFEYQMASFSAPFLFFHSFSVLASIIAVISAIALVIAVVFVVDAVVKFVKKHKFDNNLFDDDSKNKYYLTSYFISNYQYSFSIFRRLRN